MSMTREEAIALLNEQYETCKRIYDCSADQRKSYPNVPQFMEALDLALTALRPVSREQVEKMWRGCPECKPRCGLCVHMGQWDKYGKPYVCEKCVGFSNFESDQKFCECCGRPLTDEAVQMVMERLEALNGET